MSDPSKPSPLEDVEQALESGGGGGDVPYSPSLGPEVADLADVGMELPPEVSSAPAEAASFSERSAPEFVQEDVEIEVERRQMIPMIDVCLCSERVRVGMFDFSRSALCSFARSTTSRSFPSGGFRTVSLKPTKEFELESS